MKKMLITKYSLQKVGVKVMNALEATYKPRIISLFTAMYHEPLQSDSVLLVKAYQSSFACKLDDSYSGSSCDSSWHSYPGRLSDLD